jgi:hypothetical protein
VISTVAKIMISPPLATVLSPFTLVALIQLLHSSMEVGAFLGLIGTAKSITKTVCAASASLESWRRSPLVTQATSQLFLHKTLLNAVSI